MLREVIFCFGLGLIMGNGLGALVLLNAQLAKSFSRFLRLVLWWPAFLTPFGAGVFLSESMTAILSACYHYVQGRAVLGLERRGSWIYAARETLLQTLLITFISQLWALHWQWFAFPNFIRVLPAFEIFAALAVLVGLVNWCFHAGFNVTAKRHAAITNRLTEAENSKAVKEFLLLAIVCGLLWELFSTLGFMPFFAGPFQGLNAVYELLPNGEIWGDIGLSLFEITTGLVFAGGVATVVLLGSRNATFQNIVFRLLPLTYISFIALWLVVFALVSSSAMKGQNFMYFWHKAIAISCLSFFPFVEALHGFRERSLLHRVVLAIEAALPIAFVAMVFGEAFAATQGLGFSITVAGATGNSAKALGIAFVTFALLVGLSLALRGLARTLSAIGRNTGS